jgi:hypothetical protein
MTWHRTSTPCCATFAALGRSRCSISAVAGSRPARLHRARAPCDRAGRGAGAGGDGPQPQRLRSLAAGFPAPAVAGGALRRHLCQCLAVPCAAPGVAARAARIALDAEPGGVLFSSNPRGENQESINGERYGAYYDLTTWRDYVVEAGFVELEHYYRPAGLPCEQQPWLASVWRRAERA